MKRINTLRVISKIPWAPINIVVSGDECFGGSFFNQNKNLTRGRSCCYSNEINSSAGPQLEREGAPLDCHFDGNAGFK